MEYKKNDPFYTHFDEYNEAIQKYGQFIFDSSVITDFETFCKMIDEKNKNDKERFEKAIIALFKLIENGDKIEYQIVFMEKYKKYLNLKLENDPKEFYNNKLSWYILTTNYEGKSNDFDFIENKSKENKNKIEEELDKLIDKVNNNVSLTVSEKEYFENYILINALKGSINSDLVFEFFNMFPIENTDTFKNKQLFLLYMISKKIYELDISSFISFHEDINYESRTAGEIRYYSDGIPKIDIYEIDERIIKTDENLFDILYVLYHEIGHLNQKMNADSFSAELQETFEIERFIKNKNNKFYHENHDHFMIERQANIYAITELMKDFPDNKIIMEICKKEADKLEQLDKTNPDFFSIELKEYEKFNFDSLTEEVETKIL